MFSQSALALARRSVYLGVRVLVIVVLIVLLAGQPGYDHTSGAARAEENLSVSVSASLPAPKADLTSLPLSFVANVGQVVPDVRFEVRGMGSDLYFSPDTVAMVLPGDTADAFHTVRLQHIGANPSPELTATDRRPGIVNYILGDDTSQWLTNIPTYAGVTYEELYPGITLHYDGTTGLLKGTYWITPDADPDVIRWRYSGIQHIELDPVTQDLRLYPSQADGAPYLTEFAPDAWQFIDGVQVPVDARYALFTDRSIGVILGDYDPTQALFLDPLLQYGTYFGGSAADEGFGIAGDSSGNVYLTGRTNSTNFPRQSPIQLNNGGSDDAFVSKISVFANEMVYSTFLGGSSGDKAYDIAIGSDGSAYLTGETMSANFPGALNAYNEGTDGFVTKVNPAGNGLVYSVYLGGTSTDRGIGLAVSATGHVLVTGDTSSTDFPVTVGSTLPGGTALRGTRDAFLTKILPDGTGWSFSSYLGGNEADRGNSIALDASNFAYITGTTFSSDFPTAGPASSFAGEGDVFVAKVSTAGAPVFSFSAFLGGSALDEGASIAVGTGGIVYVTGTTQSSNIPVQNPLLQGGTYNGGRDAFVAAYSSTGVRSYFTYLGGFTEDKGAGIALDTNGDIYIVGETQSANHPTDPTKNFPIVEGFQTSHGGGLSDAFVTKIVALTNEIEFSSYIGGTGEDQGYALSVVGNGTLYITGDTTSITGFPPPPLVSGFQRGGNTDAFIIRIGANEADLEVNKLDTIDPVAVGQNLPYTITVRNHGPDSSIVTLVDGPLATYFAYVSAEPQQGTCAYDGVTREVTCELGLMEAGAEVLVNLVLNVTAKPGNNFPAFNRVTVYGSEYDPKLTAEGSQNEHSQPTVVQYQADLEVSKLASRYRVRADETVVFTILIRNLGPGTATSVRLTDLLSTNLIFESANPTAGTYNALTGLWDVGTITPNTDATLTINARVKDTAANGTVIPNAATNLQSAVNDPVSTNNSAAVELLVVTEVPEPGCHPSPTNPTEIVICLFG